MKPATWLGRLSVGALIAVGTAGSMVTLSAVAPAGAAAAAPKPGNVAVRQGITAASLKGTRISAAAATTKMTVSFVLDLRNATTLESAVEGGMHGGYLSVSKFASQYGQSKANIAALEKYLAGNGIKCTTYADGLDVVTTGTASDYLRALGTKISLYRLKALPARGSQAARPATIVHGTTSPALLPVKLAAFVYAILGLTSYPVASTNTVHSPLANRQTSSHAAQVYSRTPASFASQYGLTSLYKKGFKGQGETLGIITYASVRPSDATYFWSKVLKISTKANRIRLDNIDGGSGAVSANAGSGETSVDVEQSGALAPQASIIVYQAPNSDYGQADAWFTAASQNTAASVSTSWGESEILNEEIGANGTEAATFGGIFDEAGLEMAAQGQTAFDAAGDDGAYDDASDFDPTTGNPTPYTELSVDNPANSPWLTAAGGTTEAGKVPIAPTTSVTIPAQRAWGWDYLWPYYAIISSDTTEGQMAADPTWTAGGGGGYSVVEPRPSYQKAIPNIGTFTAVPYLRPDPSTDVLFGTTTACTAPVAGVPCVPTAWIPWTSAPSPDVAAPPATVTGTAGGRAVPDISADADPDTGYLLYYSGQSPALENGWGGTSFVAPQLNGSAAVIDSFLHHRSGFWNPEIYKFAVHKYTPFHPLDTPGPTNDNLYYTGMRGTVYNPGTGLGTPLLGLLALNFKYHS